MMNGEKERIAVREEQRTKRANHEWVAELRGDCGNASQRQAYEDLASYLFRVALNDLHQRATELAFLSGFDSREISEIAQDYVQELLERIAVDDHLLLTGYRGAGNFTSWVAVILHRQIVGDLRKFEYAKRAHSVSSQLLERQPDPVNSAQFELMRRQIHDALQCCIDQLQERTRKVFYLRLIEELPAKVVAERLGITVQVVNAQLCRAKPKLRRCLRQAGIDHDVLTLFDGASTTRDVVIRATNGCACCK